MKRGPESDAALHYVFNISSVTIDNDVERVFITHVTVMDSSKNLCNTLHLHHNRVQLLGSKSKKNLNSFWTIAYKALNTVSYEVDLSVVLD